jgi:23S rRNA (cytosine1962-C5)-methyltransferase
MIDVVQNEVWTNLEHKKKEFMRIFHGRGGCFEGFKFLTIDSIDTLLFIVFFDKCDEVIEKALIEFLKTLKNKGFNTAILQRRYLSKAPSEVLFGEVEEEKYAIENGLKYYLNFLNNQNIGFFADMKKGREFVSQHCRGKNVLNLFSYTCSFSVVASHHGAKQIINVDMSKAALNTGRENHYLNDLETNNIKFLPFNILKSWSKIRKYAPYDLIIIDPPSFQKGSFVASKDYSKIIRRLGELSDENTQVLACLNDPILDESFIQTLFEENANEFVFEKRLDNLESFKTVDENRSLKNLIFKRVNAFIAT